MTCSVCGSGNLIAQYEADPKGGGYAEGEDIPARLMGIECADCEAIQ